MLETTEEDIALQDGLLEIFNIATYQSMREDAEQILLSCSMIEKRTKKMIPSEARSDITYLIGLVRRLVQ